MLIAAIAVALLISRNDIEEPTPNADTTIVEASQNTDREDCPEVRQLSLSRQGSCFEKRTEPKVTAVFVAYGDFMTEGELDLTVNTTVDRFSLATGGQLNLVPSGRIMMDLPEEGAFVFGLEHDYSTTQQQYPWLSRSQAESIWYYDNSDWETNAGEVHQRIKDEHPDALQNADIAIILTEQQAEGLGVAAGRFLMILQPAYGGWANGAISDARYTSSPYTLADEAIHEIGHFLGLDHSGPDDFSDPEGISVCEGSIYVNDVMSYCRDRTAVSESVYFTYLDCNLKHIVDNSIPALQEGMKPPLQTTSCQ